MSRQTKLVAWILIVWVFVAGTGIARATEVITVAIDREYAPYEFVADDGDAQGFTPNLLRAIAKEIGFRVKFVPLSWPDAVRGLKSGAVDLVNMIRTPERENKYALSRPHSKIDQAIFRNSRNGEIIDLDTLSGHVVALQEKDISTERLASRDDFKKRIVRSKIEGMLMLSVGKVDAFLASTHGGLRLIREYDLKDVELAKAGVFPMDFSFAARKDNIDLIRRLDVGLLHLKASGRLKALRDKWLLSRLPGNTWVVTHIKSILSIGALLLGVMVVILTIALLKRKQADKIVKASLAEKEVLIHEIHHRVKNNLQVVSGLLSMQAKSATDDKVRDALLESERRIEVMARVHDNLYLSDDLSHINTRSYLGAIVSDLERSYIGGSSHVDFYVDVDDIDLKVSHAISIGQIVSELISNSIKHAFPNKRNGKVTVSLKQRGEKTIELSVGDNGIGLFTENAASLSSLPKRLGLRLVNQLADSLGGKINVDCSGGTCFQIVMEREIS